MVVDDAGARRIVCPSEGAYSNNAACVGGGTFSYGAQAWRYMEKDFRMRSTYGAVAGSTLDDWPISYARPGALLRKGRMGNGRFRRRYEQPLQRRRAASPCPCRRCRRAASTRSCKPAAERLGLHPFDIPMLRNTVPYNGRAVLHALPLVRGLRLRS